MLLIEKYYSGKNFYISFIYSIFIFLVSLQPFDFDPQDKNRHKFMVQSMYAPPGEINQESLVC